MLSKFNFQNGVIALNIHEEHIIKDTSGKVDKKDIVKFRKEKLTKLQMKSGEWSSCIVEAAGQKQHCLYTGTNMLLHTLQDYATEAHTKLYYQLADANDLILTDFFRYTQNIEEGKTVLLVYLGIEYRKRGICTVPFLFRYSFFWLEFSKRFCSNRSALSISGQINFKELPPVALYTTFQIHLK